MVDETEFDIMDAEDAEDAREQLDDAIRSEFFTAGSYDELVARADMAEKLAEELAETHAALCFFDAKYLSSPRYKENKAVLAEWDALKGGK